MDYLKIIWCATLTTLIAETSGTTYPPNITFSKAYIEIPEDTSNGTLLMTVGAESRNGQTVTIEIGEDGTKDLIRINKTSSGHIAYASVYLNAKLDADRGLTEYKLYFKAKDTNTEALGSINLFVADVNDEHPEFQNEPYQQYIDENQALNSELNFKISATDLDRGIGGQIYYSMQASGQAADTYNGVFEIDRISGKLKLKKELDYETTNFYQYTVTATDGEGLNTSTNLLIRVRDVQDTPPFFQGLPYLPVIQENTLLSTVIARVVAIDGDRGIPNDVQYDIIHNDLGNCSSLFSIDTKTGNVSVSAPIDVDVGVLREKGGFCTITIQAEEVSSTHTQHGNYTSETTMTVTVLDMNDNTPEFKQPSFNATVQENITGIPITIVGFTGIDITDKDYSSENNTFDVRVLYNGNIYHNLVPTPSLIFSSGNVQLRLNQSFTEGYDYETNSEYEFQIVATETKAKEARNQTCTVYLTIEDVNDNDPVFNQSEFHISVKENRENDFLITSITASDMDTGQYGEITYSLQGSEGKFDIHPKSGAIYAVYNRSVHTDGYPLDREKKDVYYMTLQAEDGGRRRTAVSLVVTLTDVNDNPPHFLQNGYVVSLQEENDKFSTNPFYVNASDNDDSSTNNSKVRFALSDDSDMPEHFVIGEEDGVIRVNKSVDYEAIQNQNKGQVQLIIIAYDLGNPTLSSNITVSVLITDVNDNPPLFINTSYEAEIPESTTSGHPVTVVSAYDDDGVPPNNEFAFFIETGGSDRFRVNGTSGLVFVEVGAKFDRESQSQYNLTVIAIDKGVPQKTGTTSVFVTISDVNDEVPSFLASPYTVTVDEDIPVMEIIVNCTADDEDLDHHLRYSVKELSAYDSDRNVVNTSKIKNHFGIDENLGEVYIKSKLDAETAIEVNLLLEVEDTNGVLNTPQTATGMLTVKIDDVNDEAPVFEEGLYRGNLHENAVVGTIIVTVSATDKDIRSENKQVRYKMGEDKYGAFDVDPEKGTVQLSKSGVIDRKITERAVITVLANDGLHTATATIWVTLIDQSQLGFMIIDENVDDVNSIKDQLFNDMNALTGKTFHYITVEPDSNNNVERSRILFYVTDPSKNDSILHGNEIDRLVDIYGNRILLINDKIVQIQAYKKEEEEEGFQLKTTYVMAAVIILLVLVLSIIIYFYINTSSKYKRRLKAATVSTSAEKDSAAVDLPGSNVYSATANPLLDKEEEVKRTMDNISYTGSDDDLDENDVDYEKPPLYDNEFEVKEVHMDIYEELKEQADPLSLALQGFEQANNDKNKLIKHDKNLSNGYVNPTYTADNSYESTDI